MKPAATVALAFDPALAPEPPHKRLRDGLSAVLQVGDTLWVAHDEADSLERLTLAPGGATADGHVQFRLHRFLDLPCKPADKRSRAPEVDIEGLDHDGGYLWLTGSHSLKRDKPQVQAGVEAAHDSLASVSAEANRFLLARIPLALGPAGLVPVRRLRVPGDELVAGRLGSGRGRKDNPLWKLLRKDEHFGPAMGLPGKDNGFDVEGLAVAGDRVFLGLRGPVLRGWAALLELRVRGDPETGELTLRPVGGRKGPRLRKHFLDLGGLGVRDLVRDSDDLVILAGPTMDADGPCTVFRWPGALKAQGPSLVPAAQLQRLLDLPSGTGCDRAEGLTPMKARGKRRGGRWLVVYDAAGPARQRDPDTLLADVFELR